MTKIVVVASLLFGACGGGGGVADQLFKLKEEACACKDKACGDAVNKKMDAVVEGLKEEPDKETMTKITQVMAGAGLCLSKLK